MLTHAQIQTRLPALAVFLLLCASSLSANAEPADSPQLVLSSGERIDGRLTSLSRGELKLTGSDQPFQRGEWMRWSHPAPLAGRARMYFANRSAIVAKKDWTGKIPIRINEREVVISHRTLGDVRVLRQQARLVVIAAANEPVTAKQLLAESQQQHPNTSDRVWLTEGDLLSGHITSFDGVSLELELAGENVTLPATRVAACAFASSQPAERIDQPNYLVGLADGTLLEAGAVEIGPNAATITLPTLSELQTTTIKPICYVQSIASDAVYLSDLEPLDFRHTPYFETEWPLARDRNLRADWLQADGKLHAKGLAMHSAARAVYRVPEAASQFVAELAIDPASGNRGSVVYRVYLATEAGIDQVYESPVVRGGEKPRRMKVELNDATAIILVVDYADRGDELDHALWLDARFVN